MLPPIESLQSDVQLATDQLAPMAALASDLEQQQRLLADRAALVESAYRAMEEDRAAFEQEQVGVRLSLCVPCHS